MLPLTITPVQNMPPEALRQPGTTVYDTFMKPLVRECVETGKLSGIVDKLINDERYRWVEWLHLTVPALLWPHTQEDRYLHTTSSFPLLYLLIARHNVPVLSG
jgi:hypothetical protein